MTEGEAGRPSGPPPSIADCPKDLGEDPRSGGGRSPPILDIPILEASPYPRTSALNSRSRRKLYGKILLGMSFPGKYFFLPSHRRQNRRRFPHRGINFLRGLADKARISTMSGCAHLKDMGSCTLSFACRVTRKGLMSYCFGSCGSISTAQPNCVWKKSVLGKRWVITSYRRERTSGGPLVRRGNYRHNQTYFPSSNRPSGYIPVGER